jgi:hypothetical protein
MTLKETEDSPRCLALHPRSIQLSKVMEFPSVNLSTGSVASPQNFSSQRNHDG